MEIITAMNLVKKNIHMNKAVKLVSTEFTLDDDFVVPDIKPDIDRIVSKKCNMHIDNVNINSGRLTLRGALDFNVLYGCLNDGFLESMRGSIVFEEPVNCSEISMEEQMLFSEAGNEWGIRVNCTVENIHIGIINTRKISVKAVVLIEVINEELNDLEVIEEVTGNEDIAILTNRKKVAQAAVRKKDIFRIKDEIDIPGNKANIGEIIWDDTRIGEINFRVLNGEVALSGELKIFMLYRPMEEGVPVQWLDGTIPFSGNIQVDNCTEDMIHDIKSELTQVVTEVRNDFDGEQRIIAIDGVLDFNMLLYKEEEIEYISDVYCCGRELIPQYKECVLNKIIIKNSSKAKIQGKMSTENTGINILQVCNCSGVCSIENLEHTENGIKINGMITSNIIYISDDDRYPFAGSIGRIPFEHTIDIPGINKNTKYFITPESVGLSAIMTGASEIEIKGTVTFECMAIDEEMENIMTDVKDNPLDMEKLLKMPGMVGYMVKEGDTLWNIARDFYTTMDSIKEINGLKGDKLNPGEMLLLVKKI